jgi:hypothetical protein
LVSSGCLMRRVVLREEMISLSMVCTEARKSGGVPAFQLIGGKVSRPRTGKGDFEEGDSVGPEQGEQFAVVALRSP